MIFARRIFRGLGQVGRALSIVAVVTLALRAAAADSDRAAAAPSLALPANGARSLQIISPTILELTAVVGGPARTPPDGPFPAPAVPAFAAGDFAVTLDGAKVDVAELGFRRRAVYAPLKPHDLRVGNFIYLRLAAPVPENKTVAVTYNGSVPWLANVRVTAVADPARLSPAIHVNQVGYLPDGPKVAVVGYYLGTLGELEIGRAPPAAGMVAGAPTGETAGGPEYQIVEAATGKVVHRDHVKLRAGAGYPHDWYQHLGEIDFGAFRTPGEYRVVVPGLGASYPFLIDDGISATFARTFALGLYEQRCGAANALPFTRFVHDACHTAPAEIPASDTKATLHYLDEASNENKNPHQTAPRLRSIETSLYPFVRHGSIDVSGGHHDAGDYSKYTINSAALVHHLIFAVDAFAGVAALDNLGLPESGDGKSDILQEAKWEADFLAKLQDEDGGFYFLVYPRDRNYEGDVLPDHGDPQIVWPKNTAATAAATAALAQCASSPLFKKLYPQEAAAYLAKAKLGWKFLKTAIAAHGDIGAYQKITHYGDMFMHDDEIAWAACELFLATGDAEYEHEIVARLRPRDPEERRWGWRRLTEAYGNAIRSYAFGARTGRVEKNKLQPRLFRECEDEIIACAEDWLHAARDSGYGVSYPEATKHVAGGGWFFSADQAFDLVVAAQLDFPEKADRRPAYRAAVISNLGYDAGCNPLSVCFITGLGWKRPLEIVHQYAQNDRRMMPPSGIVLGSIQDGFSWFGTYKSELGAQTFPLDGDKTAPYPILDRWGDSFNLQMEFVVTNQARALATAAWLMAQSPLRDQAWKSAPATIAGAPTAAKVDQPVTLHVSAPGFQFEHARIVWEGRENLPVFAQDFTFTPRQPGEQWVEVEAQAPDGRRVFAATTFNATK